MFLEISQNSQENTCTSAFNFIKKETLAQVFSCEFFKISKSIFFTEFLRDEMMFWYLQSLVGIILGYIYLAKVTSHN